MYSWFSCLRYTLPVINTLLSAVVATEMWLVQKLKERKTIVPAWDDCGELSCELPYAYTGQRIDFIILNIKNKAFI